MSGRDAETRQEMLDVIAEAVDDLAQALAALGAAYEQLDEQQADRLEAALFRPVQRAYGRAQRTHAAFAQRAGLPGRTFAAAAPGAPSNGVRGFVDAAVAAVEGAEAELVALQDSLLPIEVGDAELRAGLAEVRQLIADVPAHARAFLRTFGR